jgi:hypothetical protein
LEYPWKDGTIWLGIEPSDKSLDGWAIRIQSGTIEMSNFIGGEQHGIGKWVSEKGSYVGSFSYDLFEGFGTYVHESGVIYQGEWEQGDLHGKGTVSFPDGIQMEGEWERDSPLFNARHPSISECISARLCTNTLRREYPQMIGSVNFCAPQFPHYCESCWLYCMGNSRKELIWQFAVTKKMFCKCRKCAIKE